MPPPVYTLLETRLGQPQIIGTHRSGPNKGRAFWSSIHRQPTNESLIYLTYIGLAGDTPTETRPKTANEAASSGPGLIHGGTDKALYVYPWGAHLPFWLDELGDKGLADRSFGENLRIAGATEHTVRIGDQWVWGDARVEVCKPRTPCQTLETYFGGNQQMIKRMTANGFCGWYLRVLQDGVVPTCGPIMVVHQALDAPTVAQAFAIKMGRPVPA
jgi:MOSC domain-containing protein YiiM